jgi:acetylornithine deacetylase/succinyl-diaminopimelate desuccinylase-like protein
LPVAGSVAPSTTAAAAAPFAADAYFELHIEQGPLLERDNKQIGIVTGAQGQVWYDAVVVGQDSHAGTTPPSARKDALVCAARIIDLVDRLMRARGDDGRGTVGQLHVLPNSRNVVPGEVRFSVEFRHPHDAQVDALDTEFPAAAQARFAVSTQPLVGAVVPGVAHRISSASAGCCAMPAKSSADAASRSPFEMKRSYTGRTEYNLSPRIEASMLV